MVVRVRGWMLGLRDHRRVVGFGLVAACGWGTAITVAILVKENPTEQGQELTSLPNKNTLAQNL